MSTRELERAIVTQDGSYYLGSFDTCAASYRALVAGLTAAASGSSPTQRACVSRVFGHTIERRDLRQLYEASAAGEGSPVSVEARMRSAIAACQ